MTELLQNQLGQKVFPGHRLDKDTSGLLLFSKTAGGAEQLRQHWEQATKTYHFLTHHRPTQKEWQVDSPVDGKKALTKMKWINDANDLYLLEAQILTGRIHQVRKHALESKTPVLGDTLYGGAPAESLCLHSSTITIPELDMDLQTPLPPRFEMRLSQETLSPLLLQWAEALYWRRQLSLFNQDHNNCFRWLHHDGGPIRADQYGPHLHLGWWKENPPSDKEWQDIDLLVNWIPEASSWSLRHYSKEAQSRQQLKNTHSESRWQAQENDLNYELRHDQGLSPGLFTDQRATRAWAKQNSQGQKALNLFCYTGGFSVAAASSGATQVDSVDAKKNYLDWTRKNFEINGLDTSAHRFFCRDSLTFLQKSSPESYDLIFCDPPTFGRFEKKVFRLPKDAEALLELCFRALKLRGNLYFSSNYEGWSYSDWLPLLKNTCPGATITPAPFASPEHLPSETKPLLKSFLVTK